VVFERIAKPRGAPLYEGFAANKEFCDGGFRAIELVASSK
jgi:hypothetical protein